MEIIISLSIELYNISVYEINMYMFSIEMQSYLIFYFAIRIIHIKVVFKILWRVCVFDSWINFTSKMKSLKAFKSKILLYVFVNTSFFTRWFSPVI